jgi:signal transduction histidine kinase
MPLLLYVTADAAALDQVTDLLSELGVTVVSGGDGRDLPPMKPRPDVVVIDTRLHACDAATFFARWKRGWTGARPPVLVLADRDAAEAGLAAARMGADDVIVRPFDPFGFSARVGGLLARAELVEARERVQTIEFRNQELESFIYIVTHDMKTPVVNLQGLVGLIEQDHGTELPPAVRDFLARLRRNAERLEELLRDLLEYPRRLRIVGPLEPCDVGRIVATAADGLLELARQNRVEVVVAADFPTVPCDPRRLQQVFHNLLENAIKHAREVTDPRAEVGWGRSSNGFRFFVKDNGPGIPQEHLADIFKLFHRIPGGTAEGTGIGLAVARQLVDAHGGEISCDSTVGKGTTFSFTLGGG